MNVQVQVDGQLYEVKIGDLGSRPIQATVGDQLFEVWPKEAGISSTADQPPGEAASERRVRATSGATSANGTLEIIAAPLPGDVVAVAVQAGQTVEAGQLLCIVESMKMNNPVRSPWTGVVEAVMVAVGGHVDFGQPLVHLRPTLRPSTPSEG